MLIVQRYSPGNNITTFKIDRNVHIYGLMWIIGYSITHMSHSLLLLELMKVEVFYNLYFFNITLIDQ